MPYHLITGVVPELDASEFLPKLAQLAKENYDAFIELQTKCIFPKYKFSPLHNNIKILNQLGLLHENGQVNYFVRKIVIDRIESGSQIDIAIHRMVALAQRVNNFVSGSTQGAEMVAKELEEYADQVLKQKINYAISHGILNHINDLSDLSKCPDVLKNDPLANCIGLTFDSQMIDKIPLTAGQLASIGISQPAAKSHPVAGVSNLGDSLTESVRIPDAIKMSEAPTIPTAITKELAGMEPVVESKDMINATLAVKTLNYLAENRYKIVFATALIGLVIYDRYHENHVGQVVGAIKSGILSLWKSPSVSSMQQNKDPDQNQEQAMEVLFAGPGL